MGFCWFPRSTWWVAKYSSAITHPHDDVLVSPDGHVARAKVLATIAGTTAGGWERRSIAPGAHGERDYDWTTVALDPAGLPDGWGYRQHRPMVERSIAWLVAGGNRRPRIRGTALNDVWLHHRVAGLRRLLALGLIHTADRWVLAPPDPGRRRRPDHPGARAHRAHGRPDGQGELVVTPEGAVHRRIDGLEGPRPSPRHQALVQGSPRATRGLRRRSGVELARRVRRGREGEGLERPGGTT